MLPIALRPNGRRAVVVGGGSVATRKAQALADAGYSVVVVAAAIADERLQSLRSPHVVVERPYQASDLDAAAIAIAATDSDAVNARVVADARAAGVLVCDAGDPSRGDFYMPAVVRRGDLTISVDTAGTTPAFSKRVASEIAQAFGPEYGDAARTLGHMRDYVKSTLPSERRAEAMRTLAAIPVSELAAMHPDAARERAGSAIAQLDAGPTRSAMATAVCATRASALAMVQTRTVAARLAARGIASTLLPITTTGDRLVDRAIDRLGSVNVFVTELETALRERRADYAVHSCKDLPSELAADLHIAAISTRDDPRDAFCSERYTSFDALPAGAVVGTSSPRRRAQLAALRRDLVYQEMRGNVDTRLRKLRDDEYDAIVLAMAGLNRLHLRATHTIAFPVDVVVPAVGQGALAVETRRDDNFLSAEIEAAVNDAVAALCVRCERAVLRALRAGCSAPIGIYASVENGRLAVEAAYAAGAGAVRRLRLERACETVEEAEAFGIEIAAALQVGSTRRVVLPRTVARPSRIAALLRASGIEVVELAAGDDGPDPAEGRVDMVLFPSSGSVAAATAFLESLNGRDPRPAVIAMGPASASAARAAGFEPDAVAPEASVEAFVTLAREQLERRS